jgi:hypothetical protein
MPDITGLDPAIPGPSGTISDQGGLYKLRPKSKTPITSQGAACENGFPFDPTKRRVQIIA